MALKQKGLDEEDWALLEIVEDPILLTEFLYNTNDGEVKPELQRKGPPFKLRWYQKDLLTDRNTFISLVGGRAIGKCQPASAKVYTTKGYKTIAELLKLSSFSCYGLDDNGELVIRRGKAYPDKRAMVYRVETESGRQVEVTKNHPFLTKEGWKPLKELRVGDEIAVATRLPELTNPNTFQWHELRWLGYVLLSPMPGPEKPLKLRFRKQVAEMRLIAKKFNQRIVINDREVNLARYHKQYWTRNNATWLLYEVGYTQRLGANSLRRFYPYIMELPNDALKIFLEALFSQYAELSLTSVSLSYPYKTVIYQLQELLLRFGIETRIEHISETEFKLSLLDTAAIYKFYTTFDLPGVRVESLPLPPERIQEKEHLRFEPITSIQQIKDTTTYSIYVYDVHNYISGDMYVHNTLVLESKAIYESVNADLEFPVTREKVFATANQAQLNPVFSRLITRFTGSKFLRSFLNNNINKSDGTLFFPVWQYRFTARIAAGKGESNLIGLHVPKFVIDESQIFTMAAYTQMAPIRNSWEPLTSEMVAGVPNGLTNTINYFADVKFSKFKKYRIPSHNNPFYSRQDDIDNIKRFGGETSDDYVQLVLGRHGTPAQQVLSAESIKREPYDFYSYRYSNNNKVKGESFQQVLDRPRLPSDLVRIYIAIDPGFVDPTVINILGMDKKGVWRNYVRYRLHRILFPEQEQIIDWLDDAYNFSLLCIDVGAGGNGSSLLQGLETREQYKHKGYSKRSFGVNNGESVVIGKNEQTGMDIRKDTKSVATEELVRRIESAELVFSELDAEGTSELERISKQRGINGVDRYFIMSDTGKGKSGSDHHYSSLLTWAMAVRDNAGKRKKKLARSFGT